MSGSTVVVTGGAGFIGSAVVRRLLATTEARVVNLDKLTYAGNLESLADVEDHERYTFVQGDIADADRVRDVFDRYQPDAMVHLAAESHVDRSIEGPGAFVHTNITGTFVLLAESVKYRAALKPGRDFRFVHVSTDEVFGSLDDEGTFTVDTAYDPSSPYAASKAASDHLVRAWHRTYGLPTIVTNCSNNYGPYQFPEKLIPLTIIKALAGQALPVYGKGENVRDWLFVDDHADALIRALQDGVPGETYLVGGNSEKRNIDVVKTICAILDELRPRAGRYEDLITFVTDRPGHDFRYAIDASQTRARLGWQPAESFETGLRKTVQWYLDHPVWWQRVMSGEYQGERLGLNLAASK